MFYLSGIAEAFRWRAARTGLAAICVLACGTAFAAKETVLYRFPAGANPQAGLVIDDAGALYGTAVYGGRTSPDAPDGAGFVFRLDPPAAGHSGWSMTVLHSFAGGFDGQNPLAGLTPDGKGGFFGATESGGADSNGVIFEIDPPLPGHSVWDKVDVESFVGGATKDGASPQSSLIRDAAGSLYGTTAEGGLNNSGTVFRLDPPQAAGGAWKETILHSFSAEVEGAPTGQLLLDGAGNLYGATTGGSSNYGLVYQLSPSASGKDWTEKTLHVFDGKGLGETPDSGLVMDNSGALYGTTYHAGGGGCGPSNYEKGSCRIIYKLALPAAGDSTWRSEVLWRFDLDRYNSIPNGGLLVDQNGALYGAASGGGENSIGFGTVFKLTPPPTSSGGHWEKTVLYVFKGGQDGAQPLSNLVADKSRNLYGTTSEGGGTGNKGAGWGTVFKITP